MNAAVPWAPARQRRALQLMGIELPPRRPARAVAAAAPARDRAPAAVAPAPDRTTSGRHRLRIVGTMPPAAGDTLLGGVLRALALGVQDVAWSTDAEPALPTIAFGKGATGTLTLPAIAELRASAGAKRRAWQELRRIARSVRKS